MQNQLGKLASEYTRFITAHNAYAAGLESKRVSVAGHPQHIDYLSVDTQLTEMDKSFRNARFQVTFVAQEFKFEKNQHDMYGYGSL